LTNQLTPRPILILTADAGFGHRSAANAVAAALHETRGPACKVHIVNPMSDKRVPILMREAQADYDRIVTNLPKLYSLGYEFSDATVPIALIDTALTLMLFEALYDLVKKIRPAAILTTYPLYQAPLKAIGQIRQRRIPLITAVTDLASIHGIWFNNAADLCLVPTLQARELALKNGLPAEKVLLTGVPVHPRLARQTRTPAELRRRLGWRADLTTLLLVGSRRVGYIQDVLRLLDHSGLPFQITVVAGGDDRLYQDLQSISWHHEVHLYNFVRNLPTILHAADLVICKAGGLIVSESLACGLPLLLIDVLPGQETGNAQYIVENGAGEWARDPISALEIAYHWLENDRALLSKRAQNARQIGHPRAAYQAAEILWRACCAEIPTVVSEEPAPPSTPERSRIIQWLDRYNIPWRDR
jgi:1,2-diacylglycerol 3-beta-galactosyltransferase